jgi:hypothetical protein
MIQKYDSGIPDAPSSIRSNECRGSGSCSTTFQLEDEVSMHSIHEVAIESTTSPKDLSQRKSLLDVAIEVESTQVSALTIEN